MFYNMFYNLALETSQSVTHKFYYSMAAQAGVEFVRKMSFQTLHDAIFLVSCLAMALGDKLQIDCSVYHAFFATYLATFLGLQRLHGVSWRYLV